MRAGILPWLVFGTGVMADQTLTAANRAGIPIVIAGRDREAATRLANAHQVGVRRIPVSSDFSEMLTAVRGVINTAGPYIHTAEALMVACLKSRVHYVDYSNEMVTHLTAWTLNGAAEEASIAIVPGAGWGTFASELLAEHLAGRITDPTGITVLLIRRSQSGSSPAVRASSRAILAAGSADVRSGNLRYQGHRGRTTSITLPEGEKTAIPVGNGDLVALSKSMRFGDITVYATAPTPRWLANVVLPFMRLRARHTSSKMIESPKAVTYKTASAKPDVGPTRVWARVCNKNGQSAAAYLEVPSGSAFAARIAVTVVQTLEQTKHAGTYTSHQLAAQQSTLNSFGVKIIDTDLHKKSGHVRGAFWK